MSHQHMGHDELKCVEIASNVCLRPVVHSSAPKGMVRNTPEADAYGGHLSGFLIGHDRDWPMRWRCEGAVNIDDDIPERARWSVTGSLEDGDLTLSPSILCKMPFEGKDCGFHGFVRDGKWVPA